MAKETQHKEEKKGKAAQEPAHPAHHIPRHGEHLHKVSVNLYSVDGKVKDKVTLPQVFNEEYRPDIIRRAVVAAQANRRQVSSPSPVSGLRRSVYWAGKGRGVSRVPRLMDGMRGAQAPNVVSGRPAWGPTTKVDWSKKINDKERRKAINSAVAALHIPEVVRARGHKFSDETTLPVVVESGAEKLETTKDVLAFLASVGLMEDLERSKDSIHIRAGRGKMRNRPYRMRKSILIVACKAEALHRGARNIPGVEVSTPQGLNAEVLAPGGDAGRLAVFTADAIDALRKW